jgi:hypothetical protein
MADIVTVRKAARLTGVSEKSIRSRMARGKLARHTKDGRAMVRLADVKAIRDAAPAIPPPGYRPNEDALQATSLSKAGLYARAKIVVASPFRCAGRRIWWSPADYAKITGFVRTRPGGSRPGFRRPTGVAAQARHGTAAEASDAICRTRKTQAPLVLLRRLAEHLPGKESMILPHGMSALDLPNALINDIRAAIAADARNRNQNGGEDD